MALTQSEKDRLLQLKQEGYSFDEALGYISGARYGRTSSVQQQKATQIQDEEASYFKRALVDLPQDIGQTLGEIPASFVQRTEDVKATLAASQEAAVSALQAGEGRGTAFLRGAAKLPEATITGGLNVVGMAGDVIAAPFMAVGRSLMTPEVEEKAVESFTAGLKASGAPLPETEVGQRRMRAGLAIFDLPVFGAVGKAYQKLWGVARTENTIEQITDTLKTGLRQQADNPQLTPRQREQAAQSALSIQERIVGLTPDVKARLEQMGPDKLKEYFDAAHTRNIDDTAPTPYEIGSRNVDTALEQLNRELNDTGSNIGQTRAKLGNVEVPFNSIQAIENTYMAQLDKLGLTIRNGQVMKLPNKITQASQGDINVLQGLYNDLLIFKQSPTLTNAIDLRMAFDGKIKFGKRAAEVSNEVDPASRAVRSAIADEAAKLVGKESAADLKRYSDFMEAYGDLRSYTDRRAGGEYLLRLVLSGRGGEARQLIETIKEYTGVDLMNDATAMKIATDVIGNENTKNLFRQEIERAGYDAAAVLTGSPVGISAVLIRKLAEHGIDKENILMKAATGGGLTAFALSQDDPEMQLGVMLLGAGLMAPQPARDALTDFIQQQTKRLENMRKEGVSENNASYKNIEKTITDAVKERDRLVE